MKGDSKLIDMLNFQLADELTAISQYVVHAEMCDNWGYAKLNEKIEERSITEMKHAEKLIARILFLEGTPIVSNLNKMHIGADVKSQLENDLQAEYGACKGYNDGIRLAVELGDNASRELMEANLTDENAHIDWIEAQLDQISQMGIATYLGKQIG